MTIRRYLPSAQFSLIVVSLLLSTGIVFAADAITHRPSASASVTVASGDASDSADESNWEAALYAIQAQNASTSLSGPSAGSVAQLLQAAQSSNVTDTVGKTLFINLSDAKSQGLGDDVPTQDQIIAAAQAQIESQATTDYTLSNLNIVPDSQDALHTYGNALIQVFNVHPAANEQNTFAIIGNAVDANDSSQLQQLIPVKAGYAALTADLLAMPVPQTLAPLHLVIVNDFTHITSSYDDMQVMLTDPLRGIVGFQTYQSSLAEAGRMFTNIAQDLSKDGILFTKDEPGSAWAGFLLAPTNVSGSSQ